MTAGTEPTNAGGNDVKLGSEKKKSGTSDFRTKKMAGSPSNKQHLEGKAKSQNAADQQTSPCQVLTWRYPNSLP